MSDKILSAFFSLICCCLVNSVFVCHIFGKLSCYFEVLLKLAIFCTFNFSFSACYSCWSTAQFTFPEIVSGLVYTSFIYLVYYFEALTKCAT